MIRLLGSSVGYSLSCGNSGGQSGNTPSTAVTLPVRVERLVLTPLRAVAVAAALALSSVALTRPSSADNSVVVARPVRSTQLQVCNPISVVVIVGPVKSLVQHHGNFCLKLCETSLSEVQINSSKKWYVYDRTHLFPQVR